MFLLLMLAAAAPPGLGTEGDRAAIDAQARRMDRAFESKDLAVWEDVLTRDFRGITPRKTFTKADFVAGGRAEAESALQPISVDIRHTRIDVKRRTATAQSQERTCYGLRVPRGGVRRLCYRQSFSESWRKEGATWKLARIHYSSKQEFRLDGEVMTRQQLRRITGR
jgi:hypothetical protein